MATRVTGGTATFTAPAGTATVDVTINIGSPGADPLVFIGIGYRNNQGNEVASVTLDPAGENISLTLGTINQDFLYTVAAYGDPGSLSGSITCRIGFTTGGATAPAGLGFDVWEGKDPTYTETAGVQNGSLATNGTSSIVIDGASGRTAFSFHFLRSGVNAVTAENFDNINSANNSDTLNWAVGDLAMTGATEQMDVTWDNNGGNACYIVGGSFADAGGGGSIVPLLITHSRLRRA